MTIDGHLIRAFQSHSTLVGHAMRLGDPMTIGFIAAIMFVTLIVLKRWRAAALTAVAPALVGILVEWVLKPAVGRTIKGAYSYPSGHTAGSFAMVFVFAIVIFDRVRPRLPLAVTAALSALAFLLASCVAIAMIASRAHYLTDTIGGFFLALAVVGGMSLLIDALAEER